MEKIVNSREVGGGTDYNWSSQSLTEFANDDSFCCT